MHKSILCCTKPIWNDSIVGLYRPSITCYSRFLARHPILECTVHFITISNKPSSNYTLLDDCWFHALNNIHFWYMYMCFETICIICVAFTIVSCLLITTYLCQKWCWEWRWWWWWWWLCEDRLGSSECQQGSKWGSEVGRYTCIHVRLAQHIWECALHAIISTAHSVNVVKFSGMCSSHVHLTTFHTWSELFYMDWGFWQLPQ